MNRTRVLLAEDHPGTAERLRKVLQRDMEVIATVADGLQLVAAAARLAPDVIVTDISMAGIDGIEATKRIRVMNPDARIVIVTVHSETVLVEEAFAAGASGYVLKDTAGDDLAAAVRRACAGERFLSQELSLPARSHLAARAGDPE